MFSSYDTAFTFGGPIARDKAWFFGSYRRLNTHSDITALDTRQFLRTVDNKQDQGIVKGTWRPSVADTISFTFLNDPTDISGRIERDITNAQDRSRVQGGNRYSVNYSRLWHATLIGSRPGRSTTAKSPTSRPFARRRTQSSTAPGEATLAEEQRGGFGTDTEDIRSTRGMNGSVQWLWKHHTFKGGAEFGRYGRFLDATTVGGQAVYTSIAVAPVRLVTAVEESDGLVSPRACASTRTTRATSTGSSRPSMACRTGRSFYTAFDTNGNGTITPDGDWCGRFATTARPATRTASVNYYRIRADAGRRAGLQGRTAPASSSRTRSGDNRFTFNAGVRAEQWSHYASEGTKIFTFDWALRATL